MREGKEKQTVKKGRSSSWALLAPLVLLISLLLSSPLWAADSGTAPADDDTPPGSMNFRSCVNMALKRSPSVRRSSMNIEISHLNESDSRWAYIPNFAINTVYYLDAPETTTQRTQVTFSIGPYNPVETHFNHRANKELTRIAVIGHQQTIAGVIQFIGEQFLELEARQRLDPIYDELLELARKDLQYYQKVRKTNASTQLAEQYAEQNISVAEAEKEAHQLTGLQCLERIRTALNLPSLMAADLDAADARQQVLGGFDPSNTSLEDVKRNSYRLKIDEIMRELQKLRVWAAYGRFMPNISLGMTNPEALSGGNEETGQELYAYLSIHIPLWTGLRRTHDVTRQKIEAQKLALGGRESQAEVGLEWAAARRTLGAAEMALRLARSREKLARLKLKQMELFFRSGRVDLPGLIAVKRECLVRQKETIVARKARDLALLKMRAMSGDLVGSLLDFKEGAP